MLRRGATLWASFLLVFLHHRSLVKIICHAQIMIMSASIEPNEDGDISTLACRITDSMISTVGPDRPILGDGKVLFCCSVLPRSVAVGHC
ncbi:hypothetical protein BX666DRAFT_2011094 [Dichotomocladium elegans]|nr:hypothetical protein BX666DRAFT_2011094 [Dichotomocladium elegans]